MNVGQLVHRFEFHYHSAAYQEAEPASTDGMTLVFQIDTLLSRKRYSSFGQFDAERFFIELIEQSRSENPVYLDRSADHLAGKLILTFCRLRPRPRRHSYAHSLFVLGVLASWRLSLRRNDPACVANVCHYFLCHLPGPGTSGAQQVLHIVGPRGPLGPRLTRRAEGLLV